MISMLTTLKQLLMPSSLFWWSWHDAAEITVFVLMFYGISIWLKRDTTKPLLFYFYGYTLALLGSRYYQLTTLNTFLLVTSPCVILMFILLHQERLQKNFITFKRYKPAQHDKPDWLEALFRSVLVTLNNNQPVSCLIEHNDQLEPYLQAEIPLQAELQEKLVTLLFSSNLYNPNTMLWITSSGGIAGLNATWKTSLDDEWLLSSTDDLPAIEQDSIFYSEKADCVMLFAHPKTRTIHIIMGGKRYENLSTPNALTMLRNYFKPSLNRTHKGAYIDETAQKNSVRQSAR